MEETTPKRSNANVNVITELYKNDVALNLSSSSAIPNEILDPVDEGNHAAAQDMDNDDANANIGGGEENNDDDDDEDDDDDDENDMPCSESDSLTYMERINANRKRNQERLVALGFANNKRFTTSSGCNARNNTVRGTSADTPTVVNGKYDVLIHNRNRRDDDREHSMAQHAENRNQEDGSVGNHVNLGFCAGASSERRRSQKGHGFRKNMGEQNHPRGMILPTKYNHGSLQVRGRTMLSDFYKQFPHRKREIVLLNSLLKNAVRQAQVPIEMDECGNVLNSFCPSPIFVHGPSGTGKSTIVRQIVKHVEREASSRMRNQTNRESSSGNVNGDSARVSTAYVNCKTIEPYGSGASAVLQSLYRQLEQGFCESSNHDCNNNDDDDDDINAVVGSKENHVESFVLKSSMSLDLDTDDDSLIRTSSSFVVSKRIRDDDCSDIPIDVDVDQDSLHHVHKDHDEEDMIEYYAAKERKGLFQKDPEMTSSVKSFTKSSSNRNHVGTKRTRRSARLMVEHSLESSFKSKSRDPTYVSSTSRMESTNNSSSTTVSFGRSIAKFCGVSKYNSFSSGCAFIVLDHAEELLSFSHNRQKGNIHTNFLSELLLLPKTMKLNLTVIAITDKLMLEQSRISNIDAPSNTLGTIQAAVCPIMCHFQSYQNEEMLRDVMDTPHLMELIIGKSTGKYKYTSDPSIRQLYKSLVDIIIDSVESTTHDIGEILRLTRMLWPLYLEPLKKRYAQSKTSISTTPLVVNRELLEKLGENMRPHLRKLITNCLYRPFRSLKTSRSSAAAVHSETYSISLPYYTKFLLLAAYLCQTNRADTDRLLYTNYRAGRKRRKRLDANSNNNNDAPSHAASHTASFIDRVPSFPLERMLSVFSSICNKYASKIVCNTADPGAPITLTNDSIDTAHLGNLSLMRCLLELRHCGLLEEAASSGTDWSDEKLAYSKSMSSTKFICRLSKQEANEIAKSLNFPLDAYLIQK